MSNFFDSLSSGSNSLQIGGFNISLPSLAVTNSSIETPGIGGYLGTAGSLVQTVTAGARGVFCIGVVLTDPAMLLNVLKSVLQYIGTLGAQLMLDLYNVCLARIDNILATVYGIVQSYFNTILNVINCIKGIGQLIKNLIDFWNDRSDKKLSDFFKRENCDYIVANLLRCMIGKMLEPYIAKFKLEATQAINDVAGSIQNEIITTTAPITAASNYINQQVTFTNKFVAQVNSLIV